MARRIKKSITGHLDELRKRIIFLIVVMIVGIILGLVFIEPLASVVFEPMKKLGYKLHMITPAENFVAYFKIALAAAVLFAFPFFVFHAARFILPGLKQNEKKWFFAACIISPILFLAGALFCFYVIIPFGLKFLLELSNGQIIPLITVNSYVSFIFSFILALGAVFELPLVLMILVQIGIITREWLKKKRKWAMFLSIITAGVITPTPDAFTQVIVAVPLYLLYEFSILSSWFISKK